MKMSKSVTMRFIFSELSTASFGNIFVQVFSFVISWAIFVLQCELYYNAINESYYIKQISYVFASVISKDFINYNESWSWLLCYMWDRCVNLLYFA